MYTFSTVSVPCTDYVAGWCNLPGKLTMGYSEQMTAAFHNEDVVYACTYILLPAPT